jgi:Ser/Thr protein kinase RdoA (MazF antagonist)
MEAYKDQLELNYKINVDKIDLIRRGGNVTYLVYSKNNKYILKEMSKTFIQSLDRSVQVLKYLESHDFPGPRIISTINGDPYVHWIIKDKVIVLFEYIEGREAEKASMKELGLLVGNLHRIMDDYKEPLPVLDKNYYIHRYLNILESLDYDGIKKYEDYGDYLWKGVDTIDKGFCHGDLFIGNIYEGLNQRLHIMDFDTAARGFSIYDIALVCNATNYFDFNEKDFLKTRKNMDEFLNAYIKIRNLGQSEINKLDPMISIYHYALQATIVEINGLECINHPFIEKQWQWLNKYQEVSHRLKL